jgi:hypothetical protein
LLQIQYNAGKAVEFAGDLPKVRRWLILKGNSEKIYLEWAIRMGMLVGAPKSLCKWLILKVENRVEF